VSEGGGGMKRLSASKNRHGEEGGAWLGGGVEAGGMAASALSRNNMAIMAASIISWRIEEKCYSGVIFFSKWEKPVFLKAIVYSILG